MNIEQFKSVAINDIVFLDLSQWKIESMTGKVIDRGEDWFRLYVVKPDGSWFVTQWHCYFITNIVEKSSNNNDDLIKENASLKAKIAMLINELKRLIGMLE